MSKYFKTIDISVEVSALDSAKSTRLFLNAFGKSIANNINGVVSLVNENNIISTTNRLEIRLKENDRYGWIVQTFSTVPVSGSFTFTFAAWNFATNSAIINANAASKTVVCLIKDRPDGSSVLSLQYNVYATLDNEYLITMMESNYRQSTILNVITAKCLADSNVYQLIMLTAQSGTSYTYNPIHVACNDIYEGIYATTLFTLNANLQAKYTSTDNIDNIFFSNAVIVFQGSTGGVCFICDNLKSGGVRVKQTHNGEIIKVGEDDFEIYVYCANSEYTTGGQTYSKMFMINLKPEGFLESGGE